MRSAPIRTSSGSSFREPAGAGAGLSLQHFEIRLQPRSEQVRPYSQDEQWTIRRGAAGAGAFMRLRHSVLCSEHSVFCSEHSAFCSEFRASGLYPSQVNQWTLGCVICGGGRMPAPAAAPPAPAPTARRRRPAPRGGYSARRAAGRRRRGLAPGRTTRRAPPRPAAPPPRRSCRMKGFRR
jgi:hypothetical protein